MATRILLPRLNNASNFNFFFNNTKKNLLIDQNFIGNQFLYRKYVAGRMKMRKEHLLVQEGDENMTLNKVATKVLNCHDDGKAGSKDITGNPNSHVPFKVVPCAPKLRKPSNDEAQSTTVTVSRSEISKLISPYIKLAKPRLTVLVILSAICSYAISPYSVALPKLIFLTLGTGLSSAAANAINMAREPEFDRQMPRTSGRPIVTGALTPQQGYKFAAVTGTLGCTILYLGVNTIVAQLGFLNIVLYAWIYTSLKRKSILNTWVGALVGAIPPLMGWAAASSLMSEPGAWCVAALLYAWQFPHFNALSHNIADQYKNAGYKMTAAENPKLNARVAFRYSLLMFPICFGLSYFGVTDWVFAADSSLANGWMTYWAYKFWKQQRENYSAKNGFKPTAEGITLANVYAKKVFWSSVWHLPAVLILAMLHKKGQWDRLFEYLGIRKSKCQPLV
ncbi:protoheme IX farnesyltransferase, mitochondrial [[Candida] railenensis]|uniref:Protoheme IX farnesyltransferase, mitochondrial n=1 Tax=[Candida] railenensis TaxID=45579 RepID=A0A9P0QV01_9ASCO|nr:protoheme IX farnesyltransferase, mitochondrial [[Candida] railenensis]